MKVRFTHKLNIGFSRVAEVLSVLVALVEPEVRDGLIDLEEYRLILKEDMKIIENLGKCKNFHFGFIEFLLLSNERKNIDVFFKDLLKVDESVIVSYFLGNIIDENEAKNFLDNHSKFDEFFIKNNILNNELEILKNPYRFVEKIYSWARKIDNSEAFKCKYNELINCNRYDNLINKYRENLKERHPLSYAQELMGKPFWNIADYKSYEFLPIYFISPYSLRLMDGDKMIYIDSLEKNEKTEDELEKELVEQFKKIGDSTRLKILKLIYMNPMYGKEIADEINLTTATVSHHLEALRKMGFLNMEQHKQIKYFSTNINKIRFLSRELMKYISNK